MGRSKLGARAARSDAFSQMYFDPEVARAPEASPGAGARSGVAFRDPKEEIGRGYHPREARPPSLRKDARHRLSLAPVEIEIKPNGTPAPMDGTEGQG